MGFINSVFITGLAIVGLVYLTSILGLSVYLSHWYTLVDIETLDPIAPHWKHIAGAAAGLLTLSVVFTVLSFSVKQTKIILIISGIMQIPLIIIVPIIISYTTKKVFIIQRFSDEFFNSPKLSIYQNMYGCVGPKSNPNTQNCTVIYTPDQSYCCDEQIENFANSITDMCYDWMLSLFLTWIISMVLLGSTGFTYYYCSDYIESVVKDSKKN